MLDSRSIFRGHIAQVIGWNSNPKLGYCFNFRTIWREQRSGMDAPPRGEGGVPRPAPRCGEGGFPAPPRKNDQNRGEVAGQNKGPNLNFLQ